MRCPECNSKFTFINRLKSLNKRDSKIQCNNCNVIFKKEKERFITTICIIDVFSANLISEWLINITGSKMATLFITTIIVLTEGMFLLFISQNWCKYTRINE